MSRSFPTTLPTSRISLVALGAALAALFLAGGPSRAQESAAPVETAAVAAEGFEDGLEPNEIDALVAPVVLYPDPLLALIEKALEANLTLIAVSPALRLPGGAGRSP